MATQRTAPGWQRAISALLAVAGIWALTRPELYDNLDRPTNLFLLAFGLFGLYLFGYFALRGSLPRGFALDTPRSEDRRDGDA